MLGAVAVVIVFSGRRGIGLVITGVIGSCATLAGAYWFLANRGVVRWAAFALAVLAPVAVIVLYARRHLLWVAILAVAVMLVAIIAAWSSMGTAAVRKLSEERQARPAEAPIPHHES